MANAVYPLAKQSFLSGAINLTSDTIKIALVRGYTYSSAHQFLSSVATVVGTAQTLTTKTVTTGIFDADNPTYTAVTAGTACESLVIYKDTGSSATSNLIAYIDTATGLPVTPNGGDITVAFDNGANKIFAL
jgi:hypothetical protein